MARKDLLSFCVYSDKFFEINKHHEIIADALQRFMEGKVKKLTRKLEIEKADNAELVSYGIELLKENKKLRVNPENMGGGE
jgi:hypothetical protein